MNHSPHLCKLIKAQDKLFGNITRYIYIGKSYTGSVVVNDTNFFKELMNQFQKVEFISGKEDELEGNVFSHLILTKEFKSVLIGNNVVDVQTLKDNRTNPKFWINALYEDLPYCV